MIKTIDTENITTELIECAYMRFTAKPSKKDIQSLLEAAPAVEPAQRCNCCGYLVTDSEHKGCLRAAQQKPAQTVSVKDSYLDQCLEQRMAAMESAAPLDSDTRKQLLDEFPLLDDEGLSETEHHCEWAIQQDRKRLHKILKRLEAGNE